MTKGLSLASMLTAFAVLVLPVASLRAQATDPGPAAKAGAPKSQTPATDEAPEVAAQPTTAEETLKSRGLVDPSPARRAVLEKVARVRQGKAARRLAAFRWRQAAYAQMVWLSQQSSSGGTTVSSSDSSSSSSSSSSSQDSTRPCPTPRYPAPIFTRSQPASPPAQNSVASIKAAHDAMSRRYP